jgi:hypothetical protein
VPRELLKGVVGCVLMKREVEGVRCVVILQDVFKRRRKDCLGPQSLKSQLCFSVLFRCSGIEE